MYQIYISEHFKRQSKRLVKKCPSLLDDIVAALKAFTKEKGVEVNSIITPLVVYAKSDRATISRQEILYHASMIEHELPYFFSFTV